MNELPSNPLKSILKPSLLREKDSRRRLFLPAEAINSICNQVTAHEELLRYYFEPDAIKLAGYVCSTEKPTREVFSILVLVDKVNCIQRFCDAGILDDNLPLGSNDQNTELWSRHSTFNEPLLPDNSPEDSDMIEIFYEKQWSAHCRGLVEALETIHFTRIDSIYQSEGDLDKDYGLRLDIKPSNILYFSQETETSPYGILKLADCGLMEFHGLASRSRKSVMGCSAAPRTYRPPDYDFNHTISKKVDVWAMGCVFTEFLTWAILPHESVDEYRLARTQEPSVTSARQEYRKNYENSFFQHFLQYEVTDGAVVSVPELATQTDHISWHVRARQTSSNTWRLDSDEFRIAEIPKLKSSVSQRQYETEPGSIMKFLAFIKKKMMHPERVQRADCQRILEFFKEHLDKADIRIKEPPSSNDNWFGAR
ncbi:hypothetical protein V3481_009186 [Fusarium oxysporum f. sp. vasinfectum]